MLRVLLTSVLILFVVLPHGFCFCHYVEAAPPRDEPTCCETEEPAPPADSPDDHDADCPCKLREVPSCSPAPVDARRDGSVSFAAFPAVQDFTASPIGDSVRFDQFRTLDSPAPLILCALRI